MKKIDTKIINDLYQKEITRLERETNYYGYRMSKSDKSHKREMKRKLSQTKGSYERIKKLLEKRKRKWMIRW